MNDLVRDAHLAVSLTEDVLAAVGEVPLTRDDMALLAARSRVHVTEIPIEGGAFFVGVRFSGALWVHVSDRLPFAARRTLALREHAASLLGQSHPTDSCLLFALFCLLSHGERALFGLEWEARALADVRGAGPEIDTAVDRVTPLLDALRLEVRSRRAGVVAMKDVAQRDDAAWLYEVARLARSRGEPARAERYFKDAVRLGTATGDWYAVALAFDGMGLMFQERGRFADARASFEEAVRIASRHGLRDLLGSAHHDLLSMAVVTGRPQEGLDRARRAIAAYPRKHHRIPALAHDVAYIWLEMGAAARALRVFLAVIPHLIRPADIVVVWGNIARAAAIAGDVESFDRAWRAVWDRALDAIDTENLSYGLVAVGEGALDLGRWDAAAAAGEAAFLIAERRSEAYHVHRAGELRNRAVEEIAAPRATPLPSADDDALADDLIEALIGTARSAAGAA